MRAYCAQFHRLYRRGSAEEGGNFIHGRRTQPKGASGAAPSRGRRNLIPCWTSRPTIWADVNSIRALEEGLENFAGCAVVVSHDRWFLDRVASHILAFEGDSAVHWFAGNYSAYLEDFRRRKGKEADQPHRIKYRKLTH